MQFEGKYCAKKQNKVFLKDETKPHFWIRGKTVGFQPQKFIVIVKDPNQIAARTEI